jgi:hypothetical protein
MILYVAHSRDFDYRQDLYEPLQSASIANLHTLIFPHEKNGVPFDSHTLLKEKKCDMVIAEVTYKSTSTGIEIGWANAYGIPVVCIYKTGGNLSRSLKYVADAVFEYTNADEMVSKVGKFIQTYGSKN